jgi:hypothetical protein
VVGVSDLADMLIGELVLNAGNLDKELAGIDEEGFALDRGICRFSCF